MKRFSSLSLVSSGGKKRTSMKGINGILLNLGMLLLKESGTVIRRRSDPAPIYPFEQGLELSLRQGHCHIRQFRPDETSAFYFELLPNVWTGFDVG
ncbi:hypothetical protein [Leisingera sp. NJS204]|uniref:hypothetical protein n=1 Tax=Leisingera sp. NJS204 TaxID=2508307 RepID=UPI0013E8FBCA|nr:hypothetical protein [Leisingera sp. NJS204]